jgi:hypothetical protein
LIRNALIFAIVTWVPLAFLTAGEGLAVQGLTIPFVKDISAYVRFLVAVPILILADGPVGMRGRMTVAHFLNANLIDEKDLDRFGQIIKTAVKFRDSLIAALILLVIVVLACWSSIAQGFGAGLRTWYLPQAGHLSLAGYWYIFVSLPILHFLILRWVYRLLIWAFFLRQVSKLDLLLTASHPDEAGGLAFIGRATPFFGIVLFALSAMASAGIATRVLFGGASLYDYLPAYATYLVLAVLIFGGPMLLFASKLYQIKEDGLRRYGAFASRYTRLFQEKWIDGAPSDEPLLGTGDIQSLADLANSYAVVERMKVIPIGFEELLWFLVPCILPALPLALTVMPLSDILGDLLKLVT